MEHYEENDGSKLVVEEDKEHLDESISQINYPTSEIELAEEMEDEGDEEVCEFCNGDGVREVPFIDSEGNQDYKEETCVCQLELD